MSGFLDTPRGRSSGKLAGLSKFGTKYEDLLLKNSQAIGFIESQIASRSTRLGPAFLPLACGLFGSTRARWEESCRDGQPDCRSRRSYETYGIQ